MNLEFLKKIKQKLQIGNSRSIHLNLYPGRYATRLDLAELNNIQSNLAQQFLDKLLSSPSFSFKFKIEEIDVTSEGLITAVQKEKKEISKKTLIGKRLTSIFYENEDTFLEHGVKTFGFGYPLLVYRSQSDPKKIINAPILIWKFDLLRDKNEWILQKDEEYGITINDVLLNYLEQDLNTSGFFSLNDEILSDGLIDKSEVLQITNKILSQISANSKEVPELGSVINIPDKYNREIAAKEQGSPAILFAGAFGLFRTQKEAVINDVKKLISNVGELKFDLQEMSSYQIVQHSAVETDPTQSHALKSIRESNKLVIHGPPGTGKSQTLTAIIVNALFNKAKCLVVCEKRTALEVIQKNLTMLGLGHLCGLIEDVNRDRKKIVDAVRDPHLPPEPVNSGILDAIFSETDSYMNSINQNHKFYGKYLLNDRTWSDLAGRFLNLKDSGSNYVKLYTAIKNAGIDFASEKLSEDYNSRAISINRNAKLYIPAKDVVDKFDILNDKLFDNRAAKEIVLELANDINKINTELSSTLAKAEELHNKYHISLKEYYLNYYISFNQSLTDLQENYHKNVAINKSLYAKVGGFSDIMLGFYSIFSKKYKQLKNDKQVFLNNFPQLKNYIHKAYFQSSLVEIKENLSEGNTQVFAIKQELDLWYSDIDAFISLELQNYHSLKCNIDAWKDVSSLTKLNEELENIITGLNTSGLFRSEYNYAEPHNFYKINYLKSISAKLKTLAENIDALYDYTFWRKDYVLNDESGRKLIDNLINFESIAWELDFELWYLFNILIANERNITLRDDGMYGSLNESFIKIKQYQLDILKNYWKEKQVESAQALESRTGINVNALYNKSRNNKFQKRNSLRKIISADFEVFTDHFPVVLVNPTVCSSLFDMKEGLFDVVIFDEASQLRVEDVYAAKLRGKNKIVAGDENQMPPSSYFTSTALIIDSDGALNEDEEENLTQFSEGLADSESLLEFSIRRGYEEAYLDIHYRSRHPDLIGFSNAAFYNSRLNPIPPARNYKPVRYFQTYGIYDPNEGINLVEAQKVLILIEELVKVEMGNENPSIGVATFNIFQRNFILDMIQRRADTDSVFSEKINILRNKGGETFFVKNLENIQGDERDIIIISTTFGKKPDGSFLQNFGPINQEKGFRLLNVIVTRAKHMMIVCTSIPEENISEWSSLLSLQGNKGKAVFYAYLAYVRAIEKNDISEKQGILNMLAMNREESNTVGKRINETAFEQEVIDRLRKVLPSDRIVHKHEIGGFTIDIAIKPEADGNIIAIECDGANYHNSDEAYLWDMFRQSYLERFGIKFIRIWSVNWWNNPERELKKLIEYINLSQSSSEQLYKVS